MSAAFDALASSYDRLWTETPHGRNQRLQVWAEIDRIFPAGARVLDLGSGTGDDALHLSARGVMVEAVDASAQMVAIARSRGVAAELLPIENLPERCEPDRHYSVAGTLAKLLPPGAPAALCIMGRFWWCETARYLLSLDIKRATRRWRGHTTWRGVEVRYWSAREIENAFQRHFHLERRVRVGGGDHQLYIFRRDKC
jgi:hypothetical protein